VTAPASRESQPDSELIAAWRRGDEAAAGTLVGRHAAALAAFLRGAGADGDDVEDLVQETFFRAFRRVETWRGGAAFRTWLLTIGSNVMKDLWRRRKRRPVIPIDDREFIDASADPEGETRVRDLEARLGRAVADLPRMQRDVFLLRAQQGAGYEEIARALGTTTGAARVHYHHAVKRLKRALEQ